MIRRSLCLAVCLAAIPLLPQTAFAGLQNDVPSCYAANHIEPQGGGYSKLLYVLIDQTVGWSQDLESSIMDNLNANLQPGTKFVIAEFSAFSQGRYLDVVHTGIIETPLPAAQIGNTPIEAAKLLNECLADQRPYAVRMADDTAVSVLRNSSSSLNNSDIMSALDAVSPAVAADPAAQKILLLASDGLENSSITSFYSRDSPRNINPTHELELAASSGMIGNFGGARVYVIGGALSATGHETYKSPQMLKNLAMFWTSYFEKSNATLVTFGEPALLQPVQFSSAP